jgi:hypothetical protein
MEKQTTAQVAKALHMTRQKIHTILTDYPGLRPSEQVGKMRGHLWSDDEIAALRAHIVAHPFRRRKRVDKHLLR